jgi:hypothetical protein
MDEKMDMRGQLILLLQDREGAVAYQRQFKNHIVTAGRTLVAQLFSGQFDGAPSTPVSHMAVGSGSKPAADEDTALLAQRGERKAISNFRHLEVFTEPAPSGGTVQRVRVGLETVFDFDEANDPTTPLREAGIFNAATSGMMYNRVVFEPVTKTEAFRLTLLWEVIF